MAQVIIYSQENGQVTVCYPTGELTIEETQAKDTPAGSIIVENDSLPNEHMDSFNATRHCFRIDGLNCFSRRS